MNVQLDPLTKEIKMIGNGTEAMKSKLLALGIINETDINNFNNNNNNNNNNECCLFRPFEQQQEEEQEQKQQQESLAINTNTNSTSKLFISYQ
jgi:hypothetical protein